MTHAFVRCPPPWYLLVAVSLGCAAPSASGPRRDGSPVQTDAVVYQLRRTPGRYEATALATYVNRTGGVVYYVRCVGPGTDDGPIFGYRRTGPDSTRSLFNSSVWGCGDRVPDGVLRPGDSLTVAVRLGALDQPRMTPPLQPEDIIGRMRIWLALCARPAATWTDCESLPMEEVQSNAFEVRY